MVSVPECTSSRPNVQLCASVAPGPCHVVGLEVQMYKRSTLGTFYARTLKSGMLLRL